MRMENNAPPQITPPQRDLGFRITHWPFNFAGHAIFSAESLGGPSERIFCKGVRSELEALPNEGHNAHLSYLSSYSMLLSELSLCRSVSSPLEPTTLDKREGELAKRKRG